MAGCLCFLRRTLSALLFVSVCSGWFHVLIPINGAAPEQLQVEKPGTPDQTAKCHFTADPQQLVFTAALSPADTLKVDCSVGPSLASRRVYLIPDPSAGSDLVCPASGLLIDCGMVGDKGHTSIKSLFGPNSTVSTYGEEKHQGFIIKVPKEDLKPGLDKKIRLGCAAEPTTSGVPTQTCHADIAVPAAASSVSEARVVSCSYGEASNPQVQKVSLNPSKNDATIDCGSEGQLVPSTFDTTHCSDANLKSCASKYADLLTGYQTSWWSSVGTGRKLTVPKDSFPESAKAVYVGCTAKEDGAQSRSAPTPCVVELTLDPKSSSATGGPFVVGGQAYAILCSILFLGMGSSFLDS